ncbi:MAG: AMP-binding protein [Rhizobiaceae bacterium]
MHDNFNIVAPLAATAAQWPDALAIQAGKDRITYGDLVRKAACLGVHLQPHLKTGRIGVLGSRSIAAYTGVAGAAWAGAAYVPLNLKWPEDRLIALMQELQLDALIVDRNGAAKLTEAVLPHAPSQIIRADEAPCIPGAVAMTSIDDAMLTAPAPRKAEQTAYIVFTSGSTGMPKGVVVSCGSLAHYLAETRKWARFTPDDRVAEAHDITFDLSVHNMFLAFEAGSSLHLMSQLDLMAPQNFIRTNAITCWMSVPTIVNTMRRAGSLKPDMFDTLRLSVFCGEPLGMATVNAWADAAPNSDVENIYGPTECTVVCTRQRLTNPPLVTKSRNILAIGVPYDNFEIAICAPDGSPLPDGETGEIALASPQLSDGYFDAQEQTAKAFRTIDSKRWYFTGDLGMRDADGVLHHMGRADNQVKVKGNRIELEEVEMHLRKAAGTDLAAVVAWPYLEGIAQGLVGFAVSGAMTEADIQSAMKTTLPDYMVPQSVQLRDSLPENINGKIDRKALRAELDSGASMETPVASPERVTA